jgi:hypothetical protein
MLVRLVLLAAGAIAALLIGRDAPNFPVVEGLLGLAVIAAVAMAVALLSRR